MSGRVLHIDDNADDAFLLRTAIEESGADLTYASTTDSAGAVALLVARATAGAAPDLVLLDINMPVNGWDILRAIRADPRVAGLRVAMLSSSVRLGDEALGTSLGIRAYLVKPRDFSGLLALVPRLVDLAGG